MRQVLQNLFGSYTPLLDGHGEPVITLAGIDWEYISEIVLFALVLFCVLRMIEAVIRK